MLVLVGHRIRQLAVDGNVSASRALVERRRKQRQCLVGQFKGGPNRVPYLFERGRHQRFASHFRR